MKAEMKKLFHQKLVVVFLIFLFLVSLCLAFNKQEVHRFSSEDSLQSYERLLEEYAGEYTEEKMVNLLSLEKQIINAETTRVTILDTLATVEHIPIQDVAQVKRSLRESYQLLNQKEALLKLKDQMEYASEDAEERMIIDPLGWKLLLQEDSIDYGLLGALLLLNISLFTIEYDSDMRVLSIATYRGKRQQFKNKVTAGLLISIVVSFLFLGIRDLPYFLHYSFQQGFASLQSVPTFVNASFHHSLLVSYISSRLLQLLGYVCFSTIIWGCSIYLKKFFNTFLMLMSGVFLVDALIAAPWVYYLPTPIALMKGSGFFRGNEMLILNKGMSGEYAIQSYIGGNKTLEMTMLLLTLCFSVIVCVKAYSAYCNCDIHHKKLKPIASCFLLLVLLSGCHHSSIESTKEFDMVNQALPYHDGYFLILDGNVVYKQNQQEIEQAVKSIHYNQEDLHSNITKTDNMICFLTYPSDRNQQGFQIDCYHQETRELNTIYDSKREVTQEYLFGMVKEYRIDVEDAARIDSILEYFFFDGDLYLIDQEQHVFKQSLSNENRETVLMDCWKNPILMDETLYYITSELDLCAYDLVTGSRTVLDGGLVSKVISNGKSLYYTKADETGIFKYELGESIKLIDGDYELFSANDRYLYIQNESNTYYYSVLSKEIRLAPVDNVLDVEAMEEFLLVKKELDGKSELVQYDIVFQNETKVFDD